MAGMVPGDVGGAHEYPPESKAPTAPRVFCDASLLFCCRTTTEHGRMETGEQDLGDFLVEQERRLEAISDLMPYAQLLLFDWRCELTADDGTPVGCFVNAWTRETLMVSADGRRFGHRDGGIVKCDPGDDDLRRALPSRGDWLLLGGYGPGDLLGDPGPPEGLAF